MCGWVFGEGGGNEYCLTYGLLLTNASNMYHNLPNPHLRCQRNKCVAGRLGLLPLVETLHCVVCRVRELDLNVYSCYENQTAQFNVVFYSHTL
jgi:hypothetical protein